MKIILVLVVALLVAERLVEADFMFNRILPDEDKLTEFGLKCIPGRTVIRIEEKQVLNQAESDEDHEALRTHMNAVSSNENCRICVCSVEGQDEYCSRRPARNVNECIRMSMIKEELGKNKPYSHERSLAYRIRRDYIWHDDEIPYEATASCRRGRSYYSNSVTANDTDIDVASDVDSLLDYSFKDICFYCVCSLDGKKAGCISRDPAFCEYYRIIRYPDASRNEYRSIFKQDRPAYFRQLSYRLRRKMDEGMFEFMENGGDTLCCDHPDGHRRNLHEQIRNKIRLMRRKVPKENIMSGSPGVGSGLDNSKCVPYVSEYTDCTDANACTGCTRCSCNETGRWDCQKIFECPQEDGTSVVDDVVLDNALDILYSGLEKQKKEGPGSLVPPPPNRDDDLLLVPDKRSEMEEQLKILMTRYKRSVKKDNNNATIKFYETIDEINEDTLKNLNSTGTLQAHKVNVRNMGQISRRTDILDHNSTSDISDLHIEYNQPHELENHLAENKIDSKHPTEDKINGLSHEEIHKILGNYSQMMKDKDLSKLVVNELTRGSERIGDKNIVPVSNITFTPENDTLTAMTFIAGNLLNKLWDMEKDASEGSFETEKMKHEKINDLLELFKEPLSLRQEFFLKNALEKLSRVVDVNKEIKNMSLCANIEDPETIKPNANNCTEKSEMMKEKDSSNIGKKPSFENNSRVTTNAINKINDVLNLLKKFEHLQSKVNDIKNSPKTNNRKSAVKQNMSNNEKVSLNLFGNLLEKITNLLSPNTNGNKLKTYNMLRKDDTAKRNVEKLFDINLANKTMGTKDKMIIDYLSNIEKHPNCFFTHLQKPGVTQISNVEGSILYNLSEFFKIKSFTDLLKIVNDKPNNAKLQRTTITTTTDYPTTIKQRTTTVTKLRFSPKSKTGTIELAKEKLKNDIKIILQDLFDLQKEHGIRSKSNINVADALPCIYNILKSDSDYPKDNSKSKGFSGPTDKINSFIESLKLDMKFMTSNRRSNTIIMPRPKSAIVWERAIKNLDKKYPKVSRRYLGESLKTYDELREMMDKVELSGNTYKNFAIQSGVAPSERLILLKTLQADVKQYIGVLETINKSFKTVTNLPLGDQNDFIEFVDNAAVNINLNKKLVDLLSKFKRETLNTANMQSKVRMISEPNQPLIMVSKWVDDNENNNFKLKRDQIINQLIMNRLKLYIKTKERTKVDLNANANYNIAKRILFHLESGNIALAKELYKVFLINKQSSQSSGELKKYSEYQKKESLGNNEDVRSRGPKFINFNEPLISVEDSKKIKMLTQDYFLKQLWNLKQLKELK